MIVGWWPVVSNVNINYHTDFWWWESPMIYPGFIFHIRADFKFDSWRRFSDVIGGSISIKNHFLRPRHIKIISNLLENSKYSYFRFLVNDTISDIFIDVKSLRFCDVLTLSQWNSDAIFSLFKSLIAILLLKYYNV